MSRIETLKQRVHRRCVLIGESDCRAALLPLADDGFCEAEAIGELGLSQPKRGGPNRANLDTSPYSHHHDAPRLLSSRVTAGKSVERNIEAVTSWAAAV
ncbi:hypothetical protein NN3_29170 [Nocardia neocaledoniensis NBRC 108232]|nr:hypothetical protein NN3_29170 [Nocardia neocaledoniensis NBRC 108232]